LSFGSRMALRGAGSVSFSPLSVLSSYWWIICYMLTFCNSFEIVFTCLILLFSKSENEDDFQKWLPRSSLFVKIETGRGLCSLFGSECWREEVRV
jgi:hypothetical protein